MPESSSQNADVTLADVLNALDGHFVMTNDLQQQSYDGLAAKLGQVADAVQTLGTSQSDTTDTSVLQSGLRVLCTESLIANLLLAVICGLLCWQIFSKRWM